MRIEDYIPTLPRDGGTIKAVLRAFDKKYPVSGPSPYLVMTPKLDGVRVIFVGGKAYSKTKKLVPNQWLQGLAHIMTGLGSANPAALLDMELIVGDPCSPFVYKDSISFYKTIKAIPDKDKPTTYVTLYTSLLLNSPSPIHTEHPTYTIRHVSEYKVRDFSDTEKEYTRLLKLGVEGVVFRQTGASTWSGRVPKSLFCAVKVKPKADTEGRVVGWKPLTNAKGEVIKGKVGSLLLDCDMFTGVVSVGTGLSDTARVWWYNKLQSHLAPPLVKFSYMALGSSKKLPRQPVYLHSRPHDKGIPI